VGNGSQQVECFSFHTTGIICYHPFPAVIGDTEALSFVFSLLRGSVLSSAASGETLIFFYIVKRSRCEPEGSIVQVVLGFTGGGTRIDYRDLMESFFQCNTVQQVWGYSLSHHGFFFSQPLR